MKINKGIIILIIIIAYFGISAVINVNKEKKYNQDILKKVIIIKDGKIDKKNNNKIVLVTGKVNYDNPVSFDELDDSLKTIKINRKVEDFVKYKNENTNDYSYEWRERTKPLENSDEQIKIITSDEKIANIKIGEFVLDKEGKNKVPTDSYYAKQETVLGLPTKGLDYERDPWEEDLEEGDIRLTYKYYDMDKHPYMSILAIQQNNTFKPIKIDRKTNVYEIFAKKIDNKKELSKELKLNVKKTKRGKSLFIIIIVLIGLFLIYDNRNNKKVA